MYSKMGISNELVEKSKEVEKELEPIYKQIEEVCEYNSLKVLKAFFKIIEFLIFILTKQPDMVMMI